MKEKIKSNASLVSWFFLSSLTLLLIAPKVKGEYIPNIAENPAPILLEESAKIINFSNNDWSALPHDFLTALQAVMVHNPALKGKQAELNAHQFSIDSAEAKRYPTLSAQANNLNDNQGTLRLNQPLWAFGKIDTAIDETSANFTAEQWNLKKTQRELINDTAKVYAELQGIKQQIVVAKQNIIEHENLHGRISRRQQGQLASDADTRLAYSRLLQARARSQRLLGEQAVAKAELQALTQVNVSTKGIIEDNFFSLPKSAVVSTYAMNNSADVRYKRERLNVVRLNLKQQKVASMPTISFRVEHDVFDNINSLNSVKETRVGLVFEANMEGLGLVSAGRINGAAARLNAAKEDLQSSMNEVRRQVNVLMINREVQHYLIESQTDTVAAVEATMASFIRQYSSGRKSWVEVLNTQRELTELRLQLVRTASEWQVLSLQLLTLMGYLDDPAGLNKL